MLADRIVILLRAVLFAQRCLFFYFLFCSSLAPSKYLTTTISVTNLHTILWTFLIILAFLLGTVYMLFAMETGPDTLLYRGSSGANAAPAQAAK